MRPNVPSRGSGGSSVGAIAAAAYRILADRFDVLELPRAAAVFAFRRMFYPLLLFLFIIFVVSRFFLLLLSSCSLGCFLTTMELTPDTMQEHEGLHGVLGIVTQAGYKTNHHP